MRNLGHITEVVSLEANREAIIFFRALVVWPVLTGKEICTSRDIA